MSPPDEYQTESQYWLHRVKSAARDIFFRRRRSGDLAALVHDSLLDSGATPAEHYLRFRSTGLTLHVRVAAANDNIVLTGLVEPHYGKTATLQSYRRGPLLRSTITGSGFFSFPSVRHGLVRMRLDEQDRQPVWSDWFRV